MPEQRQDSVYEQLGTVIDLATKAGCYDAVDWIERNLRRERLGRRHTQTAVDFLSSTPTEEGGISPAGNPRYGGSDGD